MIGLNRQQATTAPFMLVGMSLIFWICKRHENVNARSLN